MPTLLHESASLGERLGGNWKATLITPGKGSSGTYSEAMLESFAATAFPKGTKLWFNHPKDGEPGNRDARDQWGYLTEDAAFEPGIGIVGKISVLPHAKEIVESIGTQANLSIWAMGESDSEGNITALIESRTNSIDMVGYAGREGSGLTEQMLENFRRQAEQQPGAASAQEIQEKKEAMEEKIKELTAVVEKLVADLAPVVTFVNESKAAVVAAAKAEAQAEADSVAVTAALESYSEKVKAIDAEDFPEEVAEALRTAAKTGADIAPEITKIKALGEAFKKQAEQDDETVVFVAGEAVKTTDLVPAGW